MRESLPSRRVVRGALDATISHQFYDADGDPADPVGVVTVEVVRSDGTAVTVGAVTGTGTAERTVTVGMAELSTIDRFVALWAIGGVVVASEVVDVVGGTIGSVDNIRTAEPSLIGETDEAIKRARAAAEDRFVSTQNRSPFQRLHVQTLYGSGPSHLDGFAFPDLVQIRWARVYSDAVSYTSLTTSDLVGDTVPDLYSRSSGGRVDVGYVFGMSQIPQDLRAAFYAAVRAQITRTNTGIPDKAVGWGSIDGINFQIATPGQRGAIYGIPEIDDVWNRYGDSRIGIA